MSAPLNIDRWVDLVDRLTFQVFYRTLGIVSIHAPFREVVPAVLTLSQGRRGGEVRSVIPGRLAIWLDLNVNPEVPGGVLMSLWILRSAIGDKNVAFIRTGFWANYTLGPVFNGEFFQNFLKRRLPPAM